MNFKSKDNIAIEKSDIFSSKYNNQKKKLYLNIINKSENIILNKAKKEKNIKIIHINKLSKKYFIKKINYKKNFYQIVFSINKKNITISLKSIIMFRLINLLFCYAFFDQNLLQLDVITKRQLSFAEFWRSKNNIQLKEELLYQIMKLLNNNKVKNQLELLFNLFTKKNNRKLKNVRDNFILKVKGVIPKNIYEPIQKINQNEMFFDEMVNNLSKQNYKISLKTLNMIENFTK